MALVGGGWGVWDPGEELRASSQGGEIWNPSRDRAGEKSLGVMTVTQGLKKPGVKCMNPVSRPPSTSSSVKGLLTVAALHF